MADVLDGRWQRLDQLLVEQTDGRDRIVVSVNTGDVGVFSAILALLEEGSTIGNFELLIISADLHRRAPTHKNLSDGAKLRLLLLLGPDDTGVGSGWSQGWSIPTMHKTYQR